MKVLLCTLALFAAALAAPGSSGPPSARIVGGVPAVRAQFPYIVSLEFCLLIICQHSCGGAIISPSWILTAAHCLTEVPSIGGYTVRAGILDLDGTNIERQTVRVSISFIHPEFSGDVNPHDIALMKLASPLIFNELVQPIALPEKGEEFNGRVSLSGWGSIGGIILPQMPNRLHTIDIPVVPVRDCDVALNTVLGTTENPLDYDANICTGPLSGGISACSGDSGGPLAKGNVLIGIVSWGINPCGTYGAPSVYTKVSYYIDWILSTVDEPVTFK